MDAHKDEAPLKLYSGWFCPFVQRVWSVLEAKKIPYQYEEVNSTAPCGFSRVAHALTMMQVNPYHKPESLLKLNPRGLVPTLEYQNKPLYESNVVLEFLEEAYPDNSPSLLPSDLYSRARMRIWQDWFTSRFIPSFHRFLQHQPSSVEGGSDEGLQKAREEFLGRLTEFAAEMDEQGPYFMGKEPKMIDYIAGPWVPRLWVFDHFKGGLGIPEEGKGGKDEKVWARWRKWASAVETMDGIKQTTSDREHFLPIYQRYADDKVGVLGPCFKRFMITDMRFIGTK